MTINITPKPFLKWAGGKKQLLPVINENFPNELMNDEIDTYIEPFLGGGAVLFDLLSKFKINKVIANDINRDLIITYRIVREDLELLTSLLEQMQREYISLTEEDRTIYYYRKRESYNFYKKKDYDLNSQKLSSDAAILASLLIFINRTCFNGLYRLNSKGDFNVPTGKYKNPLICNKENLQAVSRVLQDVEFYSGSYSELPIDKKEKTFVYVDPPYRALPNTPSFTSYFNSSFGEDEQIELANWLKEISNDNVYVLISNSDPHNTDPNDNFFYNNYEGLQPQSNIEKVYAKRNINSKASKRGAITELLIKNY